MRGPASDRGKSASGERRMAEDEARDGWSEKDSALFIDDGAVFVPDRDVQIETIAALIPKASAPAHIVELCCGAGLLSAAILARHETAILHAYDGSSVMREAARKALKQFEGRAEVSSFDLASDDWRRFPWPVHAFVSSLAVHHLDGKEKKRLFRDLARALAPGGALVIADLIAPTTAEARALSARAWDAAVRRQSRAASGDDRAFARFKAEKWNYFADPDPDPIDKPSPLVRQLVWLEEAGLIHADVHWLHAGHAIFSARKPVA